MTAYDHNAGYIHFLIRASLRQKQWRQSNSTATKAGKAAFHAKYCVRLNCMTKTLKKCLKHVVVTINKHNTVWFQILPRVTRLVTRTNKLASRTRTHLSSAVSRLTQTAVR